MQVGDKVAIVGSDDEHEVGTVAGFYEAGRRGIDVAVLLPNERVLLLDADEIEPLKEASEDAVAEFFADEERQ